MKKLILALAATCALGLPLAATAASAATPGCAATTFCGSQEVIPQPGNVLMLAVTAHPGIGTKVIVKAASTSNPSEDFYQVNPPNPLFNSKIFRYQPNGLPYTGKGFKGGLCVTAASSHVRADLVLEPCTNDDAQQFIAQQDASGAYYWRGRGTSYVITDPNGEPAYTQAQMRNYWDGPNQLWAYEPQAG